MTARKKTLPPRTKAKRSARRAVRNARTTGEMMRDTWGAAVAALTAAEEEMARQVGGMLRRNRITAQDASAAIAGLSTRLERERKSLGRTLDSALHGALASLDIPSRTELAELTRKVETLTRRIEAFAARPARRRAAKR